MPPKRANHRPRGKGRARPKESKHARSHQDPPKILAPGTWDAKRYFPTLKSTSAENKKWQMTDVGLYSISKPEDADKIAKILSSTFKDGKTITDATGGIGGNTIAFSRYFKAVNSVEKDPTHFKVLVNNVKDVAGATNVTMYNASYLDVMKDLKQDIVYVDPPWGGRNVYKEHRVTLRLGGQTMATLSANLKKMGVKAVALSLPFNYNLNALYKYSSYDHMHVMKIMRRQILVLLKDF